MEVNRHNSILHCVENLVIVFWGQIPNTQLGIGRKILLSIQKVSLTKVTVRTLTFRILKLVCFHLWSTLKCNTVEWNYFFVLSLSRDKEGSLSKTCSTQIWLTEARIMLLKLVGRKPLNNSTYRKRRKKRGSNDLQSHYT